MTQEGHSMFDELAIFDVKLILRDPADLVEYRAIMAKLREINFPNLINDALSEVLSKHNLLLSVKPEIKVVK